MSKDKPTEHIVRLWFHKNQNTGPQGRHRPHERHGSLTCGFDEAEVSIPSDNKDCSFQMKVKKALIQVPYLNCVPVEGLGKPYITQQINIGEFQTLQKHTDAMGTA